MHVAIAEGLHGFDVGDRPLAVPLVPVSDEVRGQAVNVV